MGMQGWEIQDQLWMDVKRLKEEIVRLRLAISAPLSSEERRLIDKHCDWVAFGHAWNAVMKRRREAVDNEQRTTKEPK